jgi:hypothetical protein
MSSDWVREHKETYASKGGAPMGVVFVLPSGRKKRCRFVMVTGRLVSNVFGLDA